MAIDNPGVIDGAAIDDNGALILLLTDHLEWDGDEAISEYDHLTMLQDKINGYIAYLEDGQFRQTFPDAEPTMGVIRIAFKHDITENAEKFLQHVQDAVGEMGVKVEAVIGE